jgi:hypothetical protein
MSSTIPSGLDVSGEPGRAGVERSEPGGRAKRRVGAARAPALRPELAEEVKALLPDELIDGLLAGGRTEEEIAGPGGLLSRLTKRLVERGAGGRAERAPRLRAAPGAARRGWQYPQRVDAEDADQRAW